MLYIMIYLAIISISVDYDVTTDSTIRVHSSANKSNNFDPLWANLQIK